MWELPIVVLYSLSSFPLFILLRARLCTALFEWGACLLDGSDYAVVFSTFSADLVEKIRGYKVQKPRLGNHVLRGLHNGFQPALATPLGDRVVAVT